MALLEFDSTQYEATEKLEAVPAGNYNVIIVASEWKPTKSGNGRYLQLEFEIIDGQYKGRKVWTRLNLDNPSQDAVRIARGDLKLICEAVGVLKLRDSSELHNLPLSIEVRVRKREDGSYSNEIPPAGYGKRISGTAAAAPAAPQANASAPWAK